MRDLKLIGITASISMLAALLVWAVITPSAPPRLDKHVLANAADANSWSDDSTGDHSSEHRTASLKGSVAALRVTSADTGLAVMGAQVVMQSSNAVRYLTMADASDFLLGVTSEEGLFEHDARSATVVAISKPGFVVASSVMRHGHESHVKLQQAYSLNVRCKDTNGKPAKGCIITVSRSPLTMPSRYVAGLVGNPDEKSSVWSAASGNDGVACIDGLPLGDYYINGHHEHMLPFESSRRNGKAVVPARYSIEMIFADIMGIVVAPPERGVDIVWHKWGLEYRRDVIPGVVDVHKRGELQKKFEPSAEGDCISYFALAGNPYGATRVSVDARLSDGSIASVEWGLSRTRSGIVPVKLVRKSAPKVCREVRVDAVHGANAFNGIQMSLYSIDEQFEYKIDSGVPLQVAVGEYGVSGRFDMPGLSDAIEDCRFEVVPGFGVQVLQVKIDFAPAVIEIKPSFAHGVFDATVEVGLISPTAGYYTSAWHPGRARLEYWVDPAMRYSVVCESSGFMSIERAVTAKPGERVEVHCVLGEKVH